MADKFELPSKIESVETATGKAVEFARGLGFAEDGLFAVDMAMREVVANAVKHGNKLDETKKVEIAFSKAEGGMEIMVRDFGAGFAVDDVPDPTNSENLLKASGRGILFMRNFMDGVEWENHPDGGTVVRMTKKR